ncbi:fungal hydrophobin [Desarmillaria tabescens]|uniref:Hydrophobin n=1 Tax=Armillaria tabescens TaxID=1929756 RepID=A0AA39MUC8_ARMTA|nr:fungal hydrophobin [Desarmillaria tabescens]KAK0447421.1 fungal hydrophobin [Desarmillaria tabescens]
MLSRRILVTLFYVFTTLTLLAAATPLGSNPTTTTQTVTTTVTASGATTTVTELASSCDSANLQCCNSVQSGNSNAVGMLLGLLGVVLSDVTALVGISCTPITIVGVGSTGCNQQTVCCQNNTFNGIIAIGCVPINIYF